MVEKTTLKQIGVYKEVKTGEFYYDAKGVCDLLGVDIEQADCMESSIVPIGNGLCVEANTDMSMVALDFETVMFLFVQSKNPIASFISDILPIDFMEMINYCLKEWRA